MSDTAARLAHWLAWGRGLLSVGMAVIIARQGIRARCQTYDSRRAGAGEGDVGDLLRSRELLWTVVGIGIGLAYNRLGLMTGST